MENKEITIEGLKFTKATRTIASFELFISIMLSIFMFINGSENIDKAIKQLYIISGIGFLIGGIIIFVLLMTIYHMSKNIISIARLVGDEVED